MRLVLDTETSDLRKADLPADDPGQPQMCQLGAVLFDAAWRRRAAFVFLIKPDGWSMSPGAEAHHGITEAQCARFGVPALLALAAFQQLAKSAMQVLAHNMEFDRAVIASELRRLETDTHWWARCAPRLFCTMEATTDVCRLPGEFGGFKFPSLEEAIRCLYPERADFTTSHDAEADLMAAADVAKALEQRGLLPAPSLRNPALDAKWRQRA